MTTSKSNNSKSENYLSPTGSAAFHTPNEYDRTLNTASEDDNFDVDAETPSPISSNSSVESSSRNDTANKKIHKNNPVSKRLTKADRIFNYTNNLNRDYAIAMTKAYFRMQKEIYRLSRRTFRIERALHKQMQLGHPIIRIPRLTTAQIRAASDDNEDRNEENKAVSTNTYANEETRNNNTELPEKLVHTTEGPLKTQSSIKFNQNQTKLHYCAICRRNYSSQHRLNYHRDKYHKNRLSVIRRKLSTEDDSFNNENRDAHEKLLRQSSIERQTSQITVNAWDFGEGRLRPRIKASSADTQPTLKAKCKICLKHYKASYIDAHMAKKHSESCSPAHSEPSDASNTMEGPVAHTTANAPGDNSNLLGSLSPSPSPFDILPGIDSESPITFLSSNDFSPYIETHSEEVPSSIQLTITTTCFESYQKKIFDEFSRKFSSQINHVNTIDENTTHLIINDDKQQLHSPLSLKFLQAISRHCYCLSYKWIFDCIRYDKLLDITNYEIQGVINRDGPAQGPKRSRETKHRLFENYGFMIKLKSSNDHRINPENLKELITLCHGTMIDALNQENLDRYTILVICDRTFLLEYCPEYDRLRQLGISFVKSSWVIESILEFQTQNIQQFEETRY